MNWKTRLVVAIPAVMLLAPASLYAFDDAANGRKLATQWCASCHLVTIDQSKANADAPPFMTISKHSEEALNRLPSFLSGPHPKMPDFNLTRQEIGDLVAYIRSLKP